MSGGLEQVHCCKRGNRSPAHRARRNHVQHGELLHLQRYLGNTGRAPRGSDSVLLSTGAYYNIIRVPPTKRTEGETLEGTTVLCTIPSSDKTKPSYYHSFGRHLRGERLDFRTDVSEKLLDLLQP